MSIFGEIGLDSNEIPDAQAGLPEGQYVGNLFAVKVMDLKPGKGIGRQVMCQYKVNDPAGSPHQGQMASEFFRIPPAGVKIASDQWNAIVADERDKITKGMSWLKNRLKTLGVPDAQIGSVDPQSLVGTEVIFKIRVKDGYSNISDVINRASVAAAAGGNGFAGAAAGGDYAATTVAGAGVQQSASDW